MTDIRPSDLGTVSDAARGPCGGACALVAPTGLAERRGNASIDRGRAIPVRGEEPRLPEPSLWSLLATRDRARRRQRRRVTRHIAVVWLSEVVEFLLGTRFASEPATFGEIEVPRPP